MTLAHVPAYSMPLLIVPERDDTQIGLELRRVRKDKFGDRGSLAKVAKDADVSIALVGAIERGDHSLSKVSQERITRLAQAYGMTNEQFADLTGISIVSPVRARSGKAAEIEKNPAFELSATLQAFIDKYAKTFKELLEPRWQRWLANTDFRDEPETPEDWLAVFMYFREKVNPR
jgi:transcriptional regulator with XRE-family HTH domain